MWTRKSKLLVDDGFRGRWGEPANLYREGRTDSLGHVVGTVLGLSRRYFGGESAKSIVEMMERVEVRVMDGFYTEIEPYVSYLGE